MDYRILLLKYIQHIIEYEGISFIDRVNHTSGSHAFTEQELVELKDIRDSLVEPKNG